MRTASDPRPDEVVAAAFADWVRPHWGAMTGLARRLCGRLEGDDVVQEALAVAWRRHDRFDENRGSARAWLLALVADQARRAARRRTRRPVVVATLDDELSGADAPSSADVDLRDALRRLSRRQQLAVNLYYYLDLPVAEVAAVMGCSSGTVKSTLSDARQRLAALLGEDFTREH